MSCAKKQIEDIIFAGQRCIAHNFHGASIIDENGKEIPITEPMVQSACNKLVRVSEFYQRLSKCLNRS